MKSRIIFQNRGFLTMEIMLSFSLFIIFTISTFSLYASMQELKVWSLKELDKIDEFSGKMNRDEDLTTAIYGNDTFIFSNDLFKKTKSNYVESWGRDSCNVNLNFDEDKIEYLFSGIDIGSFNVSTDLEVRNNFIYLTADSTTASQGDLFIIDARDFENPEIISSLNTGPGVSAIDVAGPYLFLAQSSTVNQLQIIDIHNRESPIIISQLKLPLPTPTTTAPFATSIFYSKGFVYIGTTKWAGREFSIIDVSNIHNPIVIGSLETNTLVNDIYVRGNTAYLATSDEKQMRIVDVIDKSSPILIDSFTPSGWQTQEGRVLDYFEENVALGRTVGGFNVTSNHEAFLFEKDWNYSSKDIPGGVYGILIRKSHIFLLSHFNNKEFQIFDSSLNNKIFEMPLGSQPTKMACDGPNIFFATGDNKGISALKLNN